MQPVLPGMQHVLHDDFSSHILYSCDRNLQAGPVMLAVVSFGHFTRCVWSKLTERHMHMGGVFLLMGWADQFKCKA